MQSLRSGYQNGAEPCCSGPWDGRYRKYEMSYLKAVPRSNELPPARAVTVVSPDSREVVYLDESASIEIITEALKAWGLRVRAERAERPQPAPAPEPTQVEAHWQTTRPQGRAPGRLENQLSPLWLPIRQPERGNEPVTAWSWFTRAA